MLPERELGGPKAALCLRAPATAMVMAVFNESTAEVHERIRRIWRSAVQAGLDHECVFHLLSDSTKEKIREVEERMVAELRAEFGERFFLWRRSGRKNFKAGNIAHFLENGGYVYEFMLVLDADSLMEGETIRRMIERMRAQPDLAILQSTILPTGAVSLFSRRMQVMASIDSHTFACICG